MKTLRVLHLYLGCVFAPLLIFFALSGIWQRLQSTWSLHLPRTLQNALFLISTVHTGRELKSGATLSSPAMTCLVLVMAGALILTIVLGVMIAFRLGHRKVALLCLVAGIMVPVLLGLTLYTPAHPTLTNSYTP
jgi:hypothetical protein